MSDRSHFLSYNDCDRWADYANKMNWIHFENQKFVRDFWKKKKTKKKETKKSSNPFDCLEEEDDSDDE